MKNLIELKKKIDRYSKKITEYSNKRTEAKQQLQNECPHSEVTKNSKYISGSYLSTGYYENSWVCNCCNKTVKEETVSTNNYD